jgi:DNA-binding MarR family transcriptional regulator
MLSNEIEIDLLENIVNGPSPIRQRDLARIIGLSLGMTNAILKRLVQKGLLKVRKINNRNIHYVVSPQGMERIARRSYRYFRRTIKNVVYYKEALEELIRQIAERGNKEVMLVGASDLDFIIEHLCGKHNLTLKRASKAGSDRSGQRFLLYSETHPHIAPAGSKSASLRRVILLSKPRKRSSVAS